MQATTATFFAGGQRQVALFEGGHVGLVVVQQLVGDAHGQQITSKLVGYAEVARSGDVATAAVKDQRLIRSPSIFTAMKRSCPVRSPQRLTPGCSTSSNVPTTNPSLRRSALNSVAPQVKPWLKRSTAARSASSTHSEAAPGRRTRGSRSRGRRRSGPRGAAAHPSWRGSRAPGADRRGRVPGVVSAKRSEPQPAARVATRTIRRRFTSTRLPQCEALETPLARPPAGR